MAVFNLNSSDKQTDSNTIKIYKQYIKKYRQYIKKHTRQYKIYL